MADGASAGDEGQFSFIPVEGRGEGVLDDKALQDKFRQWCGPAPPPDPCARREQLTGGGWAHCPPPAHRGLHMVLRKFHFVGPFDPGAIDAFAADFLSSPAVQEALRVRRRRMATFLKLQSQDPSLTPRWGRSRRQQRATPNPPCCSFPVASSAHEQSALR